MAQDKSKRTKKARAGAAADDDDDRHNDDVLQQNGQKGSDNEDEDDLFGDDEIEGDAKGKKDTGKKDTVAIKFVDKIAIKSGQRFGNEYDAGDTMGKEMSFVFPNQDISTKEKQKVMAKTESTDEKQIDFYLVDINWHNYKKNDSPDAAGSAFSTPVKKRKRNRNTLNPLAATSECVTTAHARALYAMMVEIFDELGVDYEPLEPDAVKVPLKYTAKLQVFKNKKMCGANVLIILGDTWFCADEIKDGAKAVECECKFQELKTKKVDCKAWVLSDRAAYDHMHAEIASLGMHVKIFE